MERRRLFQHLGLRVQHSERHLPTQFEENDEDTDRERDGVEGVEMDFTTKKKRVESNQSDEERKNGVLLMGLYLWAGLIDRMVGCSPS